MSKPISRVLGTILLSSFLVPVIAQKPAQKPKQVHWWLTAADRSSLLTPQPQTLALKPGNATESGIQIDDTTRLQTMDGFGFALTGGSAELLMRMSGRARTALLKELFGSGKSSVAISYLRLSIGSSDMNAKVFTYDDLPAGEQDIQLTHFGLGPDLADVVPVLHEILKINPEVSILATPWSAPSWMKTNEKPKGGHLRLEDYAVYAQYLVKYVQAMAAESIQINAITPQNEPLNPKNTPSLVMDANEEAVFISEALGPALRKAGLNTGIIVYDHNCDRPDYPKTVLADADANPFVLGSGFHLYGGDVAAMSAVHDAFPMKNLYFTEQMVVQEDAAKPFNIAEPVARIVVGATRNWARNVLLWNLAADPHDGPHTGDGGCPVCQGAITLDGDTVTRNLAYYTIAHLSKFVPPGSVRIASSGPSDKEMAEVAFATPEGSTVLVAANRTGAVAAFNVGLHGDVFAATLPAGAVATYVIP